MFCLFVLIDTFNESQKLKFSSDTATYREAKRSDTSTAKRSDFSCDRDKEKTGIKRGKANIKC